jgi:mRNA interferase RelE/StbE
MPYTLFYHPAVEKEDSRKISADQKDRIREVIETKLMHDPEIYGKPLRQSLKGHRSLRVGDFRIIFRISGNEIIILKIGHRKDVYYRFTRKI